MAIFLCDVFRDMLAFSHWTNFNFILNRSDDPNDLCFSNTS